MLEIEQKQEQSRFDSHYRLLFKKAPVAIFEFGIRGLWQAVHELRQQNIVDVAEYCKNCPGFVARLNSGIQILCANQKALDLFEAETESQLTEQYDPLASSKSAEQFLEIVLRIINGENDFTARGREMLSIKKNRLILENSYAVDTVDRNFMCVTMQNITTQIEIAKQLEDSEQAYRRLFENSPVALWKIDASAVSLHLDALSADEISDVSTFLAKDKLLLKNLLSEIRVIDVNAAAVILYKAASRQHLLDNFEKVYAQSELAEQFFYKLGLPLWRGEKPSFALDTHTRALDGEKIAVHIEGGVTDFSKKIIVIGFVNTNESAILRQKLETANTSLEQRVEERARQLEDTLRDYKKLTRELDTVLNALPVALLIKNTDSIITRANQYYLNLFGLEMDQVLGMTGYEGAGPEALANSINQDQQILADNLIIRNHELQLHTATGDYWLQLTKFPIRDSEGKPQGIISIGSDVTDLLNAKRAQLEGERWFRAIFEQAAVGMAVCDTESGKFVKINKAFANLVGYSVDELLLLGWGDISHSDDREIDVVKSRLMIEGKLDNFEIEKRYICKDGREIFAHITCSRLWEPTDNSAHHYHLSFIEDVTESKKHEERIRYLSFNDVLTGLFNRNYFETELHRLNTPRQLPLSIIMTDINNLKLVNDVFGHAAGDKLLVAGAQIIKKACRTEDIVVRFGGDEVVVLLPKCTTAEADKIVQRIQEKLADEIICGVPLSIAFGIAQKTDPDQDVNITLTTAEDRMYQNKLDRSEIVLDQTIEALERILYKRDYQTQQHVTRTTNMCREFSEYLQLAPELVNEVIHLARMHDIGKIAVPEEILKKQQKLNPAEWEIISRHSEVGYKIISALRGQRFKNAEAVLLHHEHWDGSGYPKKLTGEQIPFVCRMLAIIDAYDAMTNDRPYRLEISKEMAVAELQLCAGTQFDPELVDKFVDYLRLSQPLQQEQLDK